MQSPEQSGDKLLVRGITPNGFRIGGQHYDSPLLLYGSAIYDWKDARLDIAGGLLSLTQLEPRAELVLVGTGAHMQTLAVAFVQAMKQQAMTVEAMDSRSAARTFNLLVMEGRRVAAALLPPNF